MAESKDFREFPDLTNKLAAPAKKSLFERQRAEAEAKRIREEAETAAVLEDFVKSFDDEEASATAGSGLGRGRPAPMSESRLPSGPPKRHFTSTMRNSGPGTLDGPPSVSKKRALDGSRIEKEKGLFAFDDITSSGPLDTATAFHVSDDEDENIEESKAVNNRAVPKPTLQMSSLPPGTSPAVIKNLLPPTLMVDSVRVIPPSGPGSSNSTERKSMSAIVTFAKDTPASDLDSAVSVLTNKYLGWGFNLSLSRHLSSATLVSMNTSNNSLHSSLSSLPFGAQAVAAGPGPSLSRAPPPAMHRGGFAPPSSYDQSATERAPTTQVKVTPPSDIRQLKLIHKTLENLLDHGPEFEALLMSRPEVQREEKWAWIWNPRTPGGIYYRWRLWGLLSGSDSCLSVRGGVKPPQKLFDGGAPWVEADEILPFEFTTKFDQFISDDDYNSSDEDDSGDEKQDRARRRYFQGTGGPPPDVNVTASIDEPRYLNPLHKAKLTHLLARLPMTTGTLRKGDVARVTAFAISHAGQGADEVVDMLISNIKQPFSRSARANPDKGAEEPDAGQETGDGEEKQEQKDPAVNDDIAGPTLIAMHIISDILSASSTSGVRHAWRYRSLFETCLQTSNVFAYLGRMEKVHGWGRLRAEKWRRSVTAVLQLWEGWCVFPGATQSRFVDEFNHPPITEEERAAELEKKSEKTGVKDVAKSKWKSVSFNAAAESAEKSLLDNPPVKDDRKDEGEAMDVDDSVGLAAKGDILKMPAENSLHGKPEPMPEQDQKAAMKDVIKATTSSSNVSGGPTPTIPAKRRRPKAEDMFADSDEG